jgi:hypothetical protein
MSSEGRLLSTPEPGYGETLTLPVCRLKPIHIAGSIRTLTYDADQNLAINYHIKAF